MKEKIEYFNQNKYFINDYLNRHYYDKFRKGEMSLEIYLLGKCKQQCEYCYMTKHGDELFPCEIENHTTIINNTKKIIDWYIKNEFCCNIDIFSAEWFTTDIFTPIMDYLFESFSASKYKPSNIVIPDNMRWIDYDDVTNVVQNYIDKFKTIGIGIWISASIDGKYCDKGRHEHTDEFYTKLFNFLVKNDFGVHPMLSSEQISNWKQNIDWWFNEAPKSISNDIFLLEVRDETWTDEKLNEYCEFLDYYTDRVYGTNFITKQDKIQLLKNILNVSDSKFSRRASPAALHITNFESSIDRISCSIQHQLPIRSADLSIPLCHRLSYDSLLIGHFNIDENGDIDEFIPKLPELLVAKDSLKLSALPHCNKCPYVTFCNGFCLGNAFETNGTPFVPVRNSCKLQQTKINFLILKYYDLGIFNYLDELRINKNIVASIKATIKYIIDNVRNNEDELS